MSSANISDPKDLGVAINQVQGSMGLENMRDLKNLGLVVIQFPGSKYVRPKVLKFKS